MARQDFIDQLRNLGYEVTDLGNNQLWVPFAVPSGRLADQEIKLGFIVGEDFPATPPSGPTSHRNSFLYRLVGRTQPEEFTRVRSAATGSIGADRFRTGRTDRTVRAYMAHVRHLFDTL